jgi:hypothetical protein
MLDIFKIPLYYIGFDRNKKLEVNLKKVGFTNVNYFKAIDGRKMNREKLLSENLISIRAYRDLKHGRDDFSGISSMGTIGCTLSHLKLWKKCAKSLDHIIIAEDDLFLPQLSKKDIQNIQTSISKPKGAFVSTYVKKGQKFMRGLHFYILSKEAAYELQKNALPIEIQTDVYVATMNNTNQISVEGYKIGTQTRNSILDGSTGDGLSCIKCILPKGWSFYIGVVLGIIVIIILLIVYFKKWRSTKFQLDSCRSSMSNMD